MKLKPSIQQYHSLLKTIDTHTMGEATRIIYDGFPEIEGETMMEKKCCLKQHFDHLRTALMLEPRGHRDMFGALITTPANPAADFGVVFMDSGGYLNMCGHGSIGTATMAVQTGLVKAESPVTEVVLDTPSGLIRTKVHIEDGRASRVSILNVPSFLYLENQTLSLSDYGEIKYDIAFGGSFFALINADSLSLSLVAEDTDFIIALGMKILKKINETCVVKHPYLNISSVDLVEFYGKTDNPHADLKNCVVFGNAQADRSPCGTGTSAKMAALFAKGKMKVGDTLRYESIIGSIFTGRIAEETVLDGYKAIIPEITGSAYITGQNQWVIEEQDPLANGFLLGSSPSSPCENA